jgi:DNA-binding CsgD family transcriptional regulator
MKLKNERQMIEHLTPREEEVLKLLVLGCRNREIAELLGLSIRTVESHRLNIKDKIAVELGIDRREMGLKDIIGWAKQRTKKRSELFYQEPAIIVINYPIDDINSLSFMIGD